MPSLSSGPAHLIEIEIPEGYLHSPSPGGRSSCPLDEQGYLHPESDPSPPPDHLTTMVQKEAAGEDVLLYHLCLPSVVVHCPLLYYLRCILRIGII